MNLDDAARIIAAKDVEIERWKNQTMDARQLAIDEATTIRGLRAEIAVLRAVYNFWQPISTAPKDGTLFVAMSQDMGGNDLPPFVSLCAWYPNAGFCTDELREPTHWMLIPNLTALISKGGGVK